MFFKDVEIIPTPTTTNVRTLSISARHKLPRATVSQAGRQADSTLVRTSTDHAQLWSRAARKATLRIISIVCFLSYRHTHIDIGVNERTSRSLKPAVLHFEKLSNHLTDISENGS